MGINSCGRIGLTDGIGNRGSVGVFAGYIPSASTKIAPVVIGVTFVFVVVTATPFKVSFLSLPAAGVVPEANGAAGA
jgi:uncharacterized membrane protein (Fun14 family)